MKNMPKPLTDLSLLRRLAFKRYFLVKKAVQKDPLFRECGASIKITETGREEARQRALYREGKTWVKKSRHQIGCAFDIVPVKGKGKRIDEYLWNEKKLYTRMAEIAVECGMRNLGISYGSDFYHCEIPQIWQEGKTCFAYVVINALQQVSEKHRRMKIGELELMAKMIEETIKVRKLTPSVRSALTVSKDLGFIHDFKKIDVPQTTTEWRTMNGRCLIISQKYKTARTKKLRERLKKEWMDKGLGVPQHTVAFGGCDNAILCVNSWEELPTYEIYSFTGIGALYEVFLKKQ